MTLLKYINIPSHFSEKKKSSTQAPVCKYKNINLQSCVGVLSPSFGFVWKLRVFFSFVCNTFELFYFTVKCLNYLLWFPVCSDAFELITDSDMCTYNGILVPRVEIVYSTGHVGSLSHLMI